MSSSMAIFIHVTDGPLLPSLSLGPGNTKKLSWNQDFKGCLKLTQPSK